MGPQDGSRTASVPRLAAKAAAAPPAGAPIPSFPPPFHCDLSPPWGHGRVKPESSPCRRGERPLAGGPAHPWLARVRGPVSGAAGPALARPTAGTAALRPHAAADGAAAVPLACACRYPARLAGARP